MSTRLIYTDIDLPAIKRLIQRTDVRGMGTDVSVHKHVYVSLYSSP